MNHELIENIYLTTLFVGVCTFLLITFLQAVEIEPSRNIKVGILSVLAISILCFIASIIITIWAK